MMSNRNLWDSDGGVDIRVKHMNSVRGRLAVKELYFELEAGSNDVVPLSICELALGDLEREADPFKEGAGSCARSGRRYQT